MKSPAAPTIRLALAQVKVTGGQVAANLRRAERAIAAAAAAGAQVVLLPEAMDLGWTYPRARRRATPLAGGRVVGALRRAARRHRLYVCAGFTESARGAVYNAAVLLSPAGRLLLHHRKLNELEIAHDVYDAGDRLAVAHTPLGTIGLMICADGFTPGQMIARTLGMMGADLILSPSAWAVPPGYDQAARPYGVEWRENYGAVARDFRLWIAGCSNVGRIEGGPWSGHACIGCSLVVGPDGEVRLQGAYGEDAEQLLTIDLALEPRPARGGGWLRYWAARDAAGRGRA